MVTGDVMPVYEYVCHGCRKEFEFQQRMADPPKTVCEQCGGELERLISRSAFQFKGGGWYKDLYATPKSEASGDAGAGDGKKADASAAPSGSDAGTATGGGAAAPAAGSSSGGSTGSSGGSTGSGGGSTGSTGGSSTSSGSKPASTGAP